MAENGFFCINIFKNDQITPFFYFFKEEIRPHLFIPLYINHVLLHQARQKKQPLTRVARRRFTLKIQPVTVLRPMLVHNRSTKIHKISQMVRLLECKFFIYRLNGLKTINKKVFYTYCYLQKRQWFIAKLVKRFLAKRLKRLIWRRFHFKQQIKHIYLENKRKAQWKQWVNALKNTEKEKIPQAFWNNSINLR